MLYVVLILHTVQPLHHRSTYVKLHVAHVRLLFLMCSHAYVLHVPLNF
jgi:hypothetical protein